LDRGDELLVRDRLGPHIHIHQQRGRVDLLDPRSDTAQSRSLFANDSTMFRPYEAGDPPASGSGREARPLAIRRGLLLDRPSPQTYRRFNIRLVVRFGPHAPNEEGL
jgi:hypothetical protein